MKITIYSLILISVLLIPRIALANVLISQVLYDPIGNQNHGEAIELYNPTNYDIDISNYVIKTRASDTDAIIPENSIIKANSYYLIADNEFPEYKDNSFWPDPDFENSIRLANENAGVALIFNDTIIDAVGWGNNLEDEDLYMGEAASYVSKGNSLLRINNTQNNSNDFIEFETWLRSSISYKDVNEIMIENVNNEAITNDIIKNVTITNDDLYKEGYQFFPNPGGNKIIKINVTINNVNLSSIYANFNDKNYSLNKENNNTYTALINVPYFYSAGKHNITIIAEADDLIQKKEIEFEYLPIIAITSNKNYLNCYENNCTIIDDAPIIKNIGNIPLSILLENHSNNFVKYAIEIDEWEEIEFREKIFELNPADEIKINFKIENFEEEILIKVRAGLQ